MSDKSRFLSAFAATASLAAGALVVQSINVFAVSSDPPPRPKLDCSKQANKGKGGCPRRHEMSHDELFHAGYWLARKGEYNMALHYLNKAQGTTDPRIITYIGFSERKLGNWDVAMGHYARALQLDPNHVVARGYLGEAYLERGERAKAQEQLDEIASRCGTHCDAYKTLASQMAKG